MPLDVRCTAWVHWVLDLEERADQVAQKANPPKEDRKVSQKLCSMYR